MVRKVTDAELKARMLKLKKDDQLRTSKATGDHYTWWDKLGLKNGIGKATCCKCNAKIAEDSTQVLVFIGDKTEELRYRGQVGKDGSSPCECKPFERKGRKQKRKATAKPVSKPVATAKPKAVPTVQKQAEAVVTVPKSTAQGMVPVADVLTMMAEARQQMYDIAMAAVSSK
jgi:hypothetical protein